MNQQLAKISVIITTYNSEKTLQRTLDSITSQKGIDDKFELELIAVDDCSTDCTQEILNKNGIQLLTTKRNSGGPNKGRNIGLGKASGDFICIVDHDDVWLPGKVISQLEVRHLAPIISCGFTVINEADGVRVHNVSKSEKIHTLYDENITFLNKLLKKKGVQNIYLGGMMYSSELKHILFEEHFGMVDFDWLLKLFEGQKVVEINHALYHRIVFGSNLSFNESYRMTDFYFSLLTLENYWKKYPNECLRSYKRIHGTLARFYYVTGDVKKARFYFLRSELTWKSIAYYITTFGGHSYVKKKFNVFG
jgi:glycosyltransferase involved in cell wall biosynthesis